MYEFLSKNIKPDLSGICAYLKAIVVPRAPEDFVFAEKFTLGLRHTELIKAIDSFRSFLLFLYDSIAADKERFTTPKSSGYAAEAHIGVYYPVIGELATLLFSIGNFGRLSVSPQASLTVEPKDLRRADTGAAKIKEARRLELMGFLAGTGFSFEREGGADSDDPLKTALSEKSALKIRYRRDESVIVGLKLMALSQSNIRDKPREYERAFMRCDFYPLLSPKPSPQTITVGDFAGTLQKDAAKWLLKLDGRLTDRGCRLETNLNRQRGSCSFDYVLKKKKQRIFRAQIGISGLVVRMLLAEMADLPRVVAGLPDDLREEYVLNETRGCGFCKSPACAHSVEINEGG
ncbi:MAG: hypothetical protein FWF03_03170, partial [Defluviitaleaceae bacterium]|nr:hypothetical protein [Defluviitaleaceae bacterium]